MTKGLLSFLVQQEAEVLPPGPGNPFGNAFRFNETDLETESEAQRFCNPATARVWKIKNPQSIHPITGEVSLREL